MSLNDITNPSINFLDANIDSWIIKAGTALSYGFLSGEAWESSLLPVGDAEVTSRPDREQDDSVAGVRSYQSVTRVHP